MHSDPSVSRLLQQLATGDQEAARLMFERYSRQLTVLAEKHLSQRLAGRVDGEDVVQSVFRTFFSRTARGEFRIDGSVDLWNLLVQITLNKARSQGRRHTAARRDVRSEQPGDDSGWIVRALNREPGPDEAAMFVDQIETLLEGLPPEYSTILAERLEGRSRTEIALHLGVSRRTVNRALEMMQGRLRRSMTEDDPAPDG